MCWARTARDGLIERVELAVRVDAEAEDLALDPAVRVDNVLVHAAWHQPASSFGRSCELNREGTGLRVSSEPRGMLACFGGLKKRQLACRGIKLDGIDEEVVSPQKNQVLVT